MGAAVATGACCGGRDDSDIKQKTREKMRDDDVTRFDRAYDINNLEEFVSLLTSSQSIVPFPQRMHPWAADPQTVGALAATQLAILASRDDEPKFKDAIREAGGVPVLVAQLSSKEDDRVHAAVVALSFLSVANPKNCIEMFEAGAMKPLVKSMRSNIDGMRAATAQTARNIFVLDTKYRASFKHAGGVANLVSLLDLPSGEVDPSSLYTQLEAVYHIEDLILESGEEIPEYVNAVRQAGAAMKLALLEKSGNEELADAAHYLLTRLAD